MNQPPFGLSLDEALAVLDLTLTRWTLLAALSPDQQAQLARAARRLKAGEPLAHVTGWAHFGPLRLAASPAALIPRPETEEWLRAFFVQASPAPGAVVLDVCTGGGAVALWVKHHFPRARVLASDLCPAALAVAAQNARRLGLAVGFFCGDLLQAVAGRSVDVLLANPPYIGEEEKPALDPALAFEPAGALFSGPRGLGHLAVLLAQARRVLRPGGRFGFEMGHAQGPAVMALPHTGLQLAVGQDEAGRDRFVYGQTEI